MVKLDQAGSIVIYEIYDNANIQTAIKTVTGVTMSTNTTWYGLIMTVSGGSTPTMSNLQVYSGLKSISEV